jgi:sialic acid synthase SpsE
MNIGPLKVSPGEPCAIVAEIGNAHNGSFGRAIKLLNAARSCEASAAKIQSYTVDELIALRGDGPAPAQWGEQGYTMRTLYEKAQTPLHWLPYLFGHARRIGLPLFSSVFGPDSLAALEAAGCPAYKIARLDNQSGDIYRMVKATGKPVIMSAARGETFPHDVDAVLSCNPGYPQTDLSFWPQEFEDRAPVVGYSYHGTDPQPCIDAATIGASIVEAHFMLDAEPSELESNVSLGESAFRRMVDDVRATEVLLG